MIIKFNWGTGIFLFLVLFLMACAAFIYFAFTQDVNLVHKEYYEKGVNYTEQMEVEARSVQFKDLVSVKEREENYTIKFEPSLASKVESGSVLFYYPARSSKDITIPLELDGKNTIMPKSQLLKGRYVIKISWISDELRYEVVKTIINKN